MTSPTRGEGSAMSAPLAPALLNRNAAEKIPSPSSLGVAGEPHGGDGGADFVAQQTIQLLADLLKFVGQHEIGRARMWFGDRNARLHLSRARRHHHDAIGEEHRL